MPVREFADSSAVSIAFLRTTAADREEFDKLSDKQFRYVPFTEENYTAGLESTESNAITSSRRPKDSKNVRGTASGGWTSEFGFTEFCRQMLEMGLQANWTPLADGALFITDDDKSQFFITEQRVKNNGVRNFRRHYGQLVNEMTLTLSDGKLATLQLATNSANFDSSMDKTPNAADTVGSMASGFIDPDDYEAADGSNNVTRIYVAKEDGTLVEMVFSQLTIQVSNNIRTSNAISKVWAAGMAKGRVAAKVTGTAYYEDDTLLNLHMANEKLRFVLPIETKEGTVVFALPRLSLASPSGNASGNNQDFTSSITLTGAEGKLNAGGKDYPAVIGALWVPKGKDWKQYIKTGIPTIDGATKSGTTTTTGDKTATGGGQ